MQVGNKYVSLTFIIPAIIYNHRFEIFNSVSEIQENVDIVLGIKTYSS